MWQTIESARQLWPDARRMNDENLTVYLNVAKSQVLDFAPLAVDALPAETYYLAQLLQARNLYNSTLGSTSSTDENGYAITTTPLDWQVKQLLRPVRAFGGVA